MKLPSSVGQKKNKAIEQILTEQGVGECKMTLTGGHVVHNKLIHSNHQQEKSHRGN